MNNIQQKNYYLPIGAKLCLLATVYLLYARYVHHYYNSLYIFIIIAHRIRLESISCKVLGSPLTQYNQI